MLKASTLRALKFAPLLALAALFGCGEGDGGGGSAPVISSFSANPATVAAGGSATLSWAVTGNPTSLEISGIGAVSGTNVVVQPTTTTTYTLTATNGSGTASASTAVTVGGTLPGPGVEDGLPPSGSFGVSLNQNGPFLSDATGNITSGSDERVVTVAAGGTFYASVSYTDPGGIAAISVRIANSSPAGLAADLTPGTPVGGFTIGAEATGCVLDGTQTSVTCVYPITVAAGTQNISSLTPDEFAYVFRTNVTDAAGNRSDTPPRGYVVVGSSSGGGTPNPPAPPETPNPPETPETPAPGPTPTAPTINSFTANPATINSRQTSTLTWSVSGTVTSLSINNGVGNVSGTTETVDPDSTTTYTLTARNGSATATRQVTVTVTGSGGGGGSQTAPTISDFTATPPTISAGGTSTLAWTVTGTVTSLTIDKGVGTVTGTTSRMVTPTATTTYTLTANNGSASTKKTATVTVGSTTPVENVAPTANAGTNRANIPINSTVTLDGKSSNDQNSGETATLKFAWTLKAPGGADASGLLNNETNPTPTFKPTSVGDYTASLTVTDVKGASSAADTVTISVIIPNNPPAADAGADQPNVTSTSLVTLDGSGSSDSDPGETSTLAYAWTLSAPGGGNANAALSSQSAQKPTFTANVVGDYTASLVVKDSRGASSKADTVKITVK